MPKQKGNRLLLGAGGLATLLTLYYMYDQYGKPLPLLEQRLGPDVRRELDELVDSLGEEVRRCSHLIGSDATECLESIAENYNVQFSSRNLYERIYFREKIYEKAMVNQGLSQLVIYLNFPTADEYDIYNDEVRAVRAFGRRKRRSRRSRRRSRRRS
jgi:hypothetical protein